MSEDLQTLAKRSSISYANEPGFVDCTVESTSPPVLVYRFDSEGNAHGFQTRRQQVSNGDRYRIPNHRQDMVLEYHDSPASLREKIPLVTACLALVVSTYATYLSSSAIKVNENSARAQLFANFQQQYSVIASQFPDHLLVPGWHAERGSPGWWALKRYWDLCYAEWYATQKLNRDLYAPLWKSYYSGVIGSALTIHSFRCVLEERIEHQTEGRPYREFYDALQPLAKENLVSLGPVEDSCIGSPSRPLGQKAKPSSN